MLRALIIEDEKAHQKNLANILEELFPKVQLAGIASNVEEGLLLIKEKKPDLVFLDVQMPPKTGFDLLSELDEINFQVVFTTSYDEYAIKAIKFNALDYLLKPVNKGDIEQALERANTKPTGQKEQMNQFLDYLKEPEKMNRIVIPVADGFEIVDIDSVIYLEADRNYTYIHRQGKNKILSSKHLKHFDEMLENNGFYRIHQSYLVNLKNVVKYIRGKESQVKLSNDIILPVSRNNKDGLLEKFV